MTNVATLPVATPAAHVTASDIFASPAMFEHMQRVAKVFVASALIPEHLRKNANGADVLLALAIAKRMGEDPVMVMQNIYVVHGRAGWSAQYMIARANRSGVFKGPISWRETGTVGKPDYGVTAFAKVAETGEEVAFTVTMATATAEGWTTNKKYQTLGPLMLRYRSATLLIRLYCPEVMMGFQTVDELEDTAASLTPAGPRDITPAAAAIAHVPAEDGDIIPPTRPETPPPAYVPEGGWPACEGKIKLAAYAQLFLKDATAEQARAFYDHYGEGLAALNGSEPGMRIATLYDEALNRSADQTQMFGAGK